MRKYKIKSGKHEFDIEKYMVKGEAMLKVKPITIKTKNANGGDDVKVIMPPLHLLNELTQGDE